MTHRLDKIKPTVRFGEKIPNGPKLLTLTWVLAKAGNSKLKQLELSFLFGKYCLDKLSFYGQILNGSRVIA